MSKKAKENLESKNEIKKVTKSSKSAKATKTTKTHTSTAKKKITSTKKVASKSTKAKVSKNTQLNKKENIIKDLEYYDLPYRYNQTIVKMLAQSPHTLFVYWDISDEDKAKMIKKYGNDFFTKTKPVLIITNKTKNYTFEIDINDFANCWYFNIDDEKCEYLVELGRKSISNEITIPNNYLLVSYSNKIESPNGHILFEKEQSTIYFRNVKENYEYSKDIANLHFINHLKRIYKIYDLYKTIYKNEEFNDANNPTSYFF